MCAAHAGIPGISRGHPRQRRWHQQKMQRMRLECDRNGKMVMAGDRAAVNGLGIT